MARKKKQRKSIFVRLLVIGVAVYMITTLVHLYDTLNESRKQLAELKTQKVATELQITELQELLNDDSQSALIEKAARERLDYGYPYETYFVAQQ